MHNIILFSFLIFLNLILIFNIFLLIKVYLNNLIIDIYGYIEKDINKNKIFNYMYKK